MSPDATSLRAWLARVERRLAWIAAAQAVAAAIGVALFATVVASIAGSPQAALLGIALATTGSITAVVVALRTRRDAARALEQRAPECRNVVITAAEIDTMPVAPYMATRVFSEALRITNMLDPAALFPARRALMVLAAATLSFGVVTAVIAAAPDVVPGIGGFPGTASAAISRVEITIAPPSYTGQEANTLRDPARVDALAGSEIRIAVHGAAAAVDIEMLHGRLALEPAGRGTFTGTIIADGDGFIAFIPRSAAGVVGERRLVPLRVTPDHPPRVRVTAPARDLFFADANRAVAVTLDVEDDLAIAALALRFTRVSGSGEQFTFTEGEVPIALTRRNERSWTATGTLDLAAMQLGAGDMIVYRGVSADRRPGAPPSESDAYIIEIAAPGSIPMEGFSADDEDKYALSQQMVIMKTERLIVRAPSMHPDSLAGEALSLAAEQRSVRAEFVFMMGGELAEEVLAEASMEDLDEASHAEADDEVIAGRLVNRGRLSLLVAIRAMSRANTALTEADLTRALAEEKIALDNLQRAFSRTRYILRALTQRERLDQTRRLTGDLSTALSTTRPAQAGAPDAATTALRVVLAKLIAQAANPNADSIAALAQDLVRADPAAESYDDVAQLLYEAAAADPARARVLLAQAATALTDVVRARLNTAPARSGGIGDARLEGALSDALRARGVR